MSGEAIQRVAVIGAGAWGTALAIAARRAGREVSLWARDPALAASVHETRINARYLPGRALDPGIAVTAELGVVADADAILLAVPAQAVRVIAASLSPFLGPATPVVICAKGIEIATGALMPQVVGEALPGCPATMLSGPTFADEVARDLPTAVTLAGGDPVLGRSLAEALASPTFRPYWTDDVVGVALGGAVKNVLAIACGVVDGRRLGDNARAALLTRGFAEMARLGLALGGRIETFAGLAGLGDLTLTCNGPLSRNRALGIAIGEDKRAADYLAGRPTVAEGFHTAPAMLRLAKAHGVEMPICFAVHALLHEDADVGATIRALLTRPLRDEGG